MKPRWYLLICFLVVPSFASAQESAYEKFSQGVALAARVDAYNAHCEVETQMSADFVVRGEAEGVIAPDEEGKTLREIRDIVYEDSVADIKERRPDCKNVGFLLEKLDLMKALKEITKDINTGESEQSIEDSAPDPL